MLFLFTFYNTVGLRMGSQKLKRVGGPWCGTTWEPLSYGVDARDHNEPTSSVYPEPCGSQITMMRLHH